MKLHEAIEAAMTHNAANVRRVGVQLDGEQFALTADGNGGFLRRRDGAPWDHTLAAIVSNDWQVTP